MIAVLGSIVYGLAQVLLLLVGVVALLVLWPADAIRKWWWQLRHRRPRQPQP